MVLFATKRLELREYTTADAPFIYELMNSEGWLKYIGDRNINSVADAEAYIVKNYLPIYKLHGHGAYLVILKSSGKPIGSCGLYRRDDLDHPDLGFAFLAEFAGMGFGFEAAEAVLKYAKDSLKIETVLGITLPENTASIGLLKKLGMKEKGRYLMKDDPDELLLFSN
jgi:RimJ/RimL family protein N-acetyltransferase